MDTDHHSSPRDAPARRIFGEGRHWLVSVFAGESCAPRPGPCLVFESHDVIRIVRQYPADWHALPDDALYAISLHA